MQAAASMALSLLATDDRDTLAGLGRWLAGGDRAQLLLRHLYYDELSHRFVPNCVHGVCLLGALCCASPPLLAVLRGDLQSSMAALRRNPECRRVLPAQCPVWLAACPAAVDVPLLQNHARPSRRLLLPALPCTAVPSTET